MDNPFIFKTIARFIHAAIGFLSDRWVFVNDRDHMVENHASIHSENNQQVLDAP